MSVMWAPPRRSASGEGGAVGCPPASDLQHLLRMGFPRHRAVKALAATGNKSAQLASDWLLTHVQDATLDEDLPREYILYACPTDALYHRLRRFWTDSRDRCGWNGAHNFTPHITLVSFFKAPDECSLQLSQVLHNVIQAAGEPPKHFLTLEPYISPNFMGLFASEDHADYLKNVAAHYVKQVSSSIGLTVDTYEQLDALATCFPWCAVPQEPPQPSICLEPHMKSLHLTLAYQFTSAAYPILKELAQGLHPLERAPWELRLYSRDARLSTHQVYKVKHVYATREPDELELRLGDYIYIEENVMQNSPDGWVKGISWLTGMSGYLPIVYIERTAESDAWTLHKALPLSFHNAPKEESKTLQNVVSSSIESFSQVGSPVDYENPAVDSGSHLSSMKSVDAYVDELDSKVSFPKSEMEHYLSKSSLNTEKEDSKHTDKKLNVTSSNGANENENSSEEMSRNVLVMRHGERVDFTYGSWVPYCFDEHDNYIRKDMNMPPSLPKRSGGSASYTVDCPLTMVGLLQARLIGEGLKIADITLSHVYSSPSYRCVQTAQAMLDGLGSPPNLKIKVEPSLFEWLVWYPKGPPTWMTVEEMNEAEFNVDTEYEPFMKFGKPPFIQMAEESECIEDCNQFYDRNAKFVLHALKSTESDGGTIMLVGHASTLDTAWRGVAGLGARNCNSLGRLMRGVPYCSLASMKGPPWRLIPPPCPSLMNTSNKRYDWKILRD